MAQITASDIIVLIEAELKWCVGNEAKEIDVDPLFKIGFVAGLNYVKSLIIKAREVINEMQK
jgi:hypothetical protein